MLVTSVAASLGWLSREKENDWESLFLEHRCLAFCGSARHVSTGVALGTGLDLQQMLVCELLVVRRMVVTSVCVKLNQEYLLAFAACGCA